MIPVFQGNGNLSPGIHWAEWKEFEGRFGINPHRRKLLKGLKAVIASLRKAGCRAIYIDGSFVTAKELPNDFDGCWSIEGVDPNLLDPVLLDFSNGRAAQKAKYEGELFPAELIEGGSGKTWLDFFQQDRYGKPKGIVGIRLRKPREKI
jgi:hypothetical protein